MQTDRVWPAVGNGAGDPWGMENCQQWWYEESVREILSQGH